MVFTVRRFILSLVLLFVLVLFSIVITSLREERASLNASRVFVCLSCMRYVLSFSLPLGVGGRLWIAIVALPGLVI